MEATFFFDPACPWTWHTSRWLTTVAAARDVTVHWRAFSLAILNEGAVPEQFRATMEASAQALRLVEALRADGRRDDVGRFYTAMGARSHELNVPLNQEAVLEAADAAGITDAKRVLDDPAWDEAVRESHRTAMAAAGPDIGSPVLMVDDAPRGLHGPIISEAPDQAAAEQLWDAILPLVRSPVFFEVKRGRR